MGILMERKESDQKELTNLNASMRGIESRYEHFIDHLKHGQFTQALKDVGEIVEYVKSILSSIETLDKETKDALKLIVDGHSIVQMLNALSKEKGFSYKGSDIYFTGKSGSGETIKVNISSAVRIYQNGMKIVEDMEDAISKYQKVYSQEIDEDFIDKNRRSPRLFIIWKKILRIMPSIFNSGLRLVSATHSIN